MRRSHRGRSIKALAAIAVMLCAAAIYTAWMGQNGHSTGLSSVVGMVTTPLQQLVTWGRERLDGLVLGPREAATLEKQVAELQQELDRKNQELADYYITKRENEMLRAYLELKQLHDDWQMVDATVVGRDSSDPFGGIILNKGTAAGVQTGDPVITDGGLVGRVVRVSAAYAKVALLTHPEVGVSVQAPRTGETGILTGDKRLGDQKLVQMKHLDTRTHVSEGDLVVTTGLGGVFPAGVVVGTVERLTDSDVDVSKVALVRPAVDPDAVFSVMILTDFMGQGETMDGVTE
ncbi:MAG: rod shape-determining protein MreC [Clostridia bacterium]|nr:rod shape-determining protein MreC [Clostridia bacterium]